MKHLKTYEDRASIPYYDLKKYLIIGRISNSDMYIVEFEEIKDMGSYTLSLLYVKCKILYYVQDGEIIPKDENVATHPEIPIKNFKKLILFQSDDLEEVIERAKLLIDTNNYNL